MNHRVIKYAFVFACLAFTFRAGSQPPVYDAVLKSFQLRMAGEYEVSIKLADSVLRYVTDYRLFLEKGESELNMGRYGDAIASFRKASDIRENAGSYGLARVYAASGNVSGALEYLTLNLGSPYRKGDRVCHTDRFLRMVETSTDWRDFWMTERHTAAEKLLDEIEYLLSRNLTEEAEALIASAGATFATSPEFVYGSALVSFNRSEYGRAIALLSDPVIKIMRGEKPVRLLAESYLEAGDHRRALHLLNSLIEAETIDPELFRGRSDAYRGIGNYGRALADLEYYLSIGGSDTEALKSAASISAETGDNASSLKYLNRLVGTDPGNREAYIERGRIWSSTGMWKNAIADYSMALDLDPVDGEVYYMKAEALLKTGDTESACSDLMHAVRYGNRKGSELYNRYCIK